MMKKIKDFMHSRHSRKQKLFKHGFAFIEPLIIITLIGGLTLVLIVLASINSARNEEIDTVNKSNLNNLRAQAELFYNDSKSYAGLCNNPEVIQTLTAAGATDKCNATEAAWAAEIKLTATDGYYCIDSTGEAVEIPNTKGIEATSC